MMRLNLEDLQLHDNIGKVIEFNYCVKLIGMPMTCLVECLMRQHYEIEESIFLVSY